jgi:hypothetical protein
MQELDAERRIQILRGEIPTPLPIEDTPNSTHESRENRSYGSGRERKRRKKAGENDTDFELRVAREDQASAANTETQLVLRKENNAPLTDHKGHISLFPTDSSKQPVEKNPEAEKEAAKKKREYEDQYTMRFSNAAGFKQGLENPWYSKPTGGEVVAVREEAEKRKKRKRRHEDDEDDLENFTLDAPEKSSSRRHDRAKEHKHRHRHSSRRSSHGEERRHRHKHRHDRHRD